MKKTINLILPALLLLMSVHACAQYKHRKADAHAPGEDIYKHYTGTIGDKKIALDLRWGWQGGSNYGGSDYYYADEPGTHSFDIYEPETFDHDATLNAKDVIITQFGQMFGDRDVPSPKWQFTLNGNKLNGTWVSADGITNATVALTEDYSNSYPMDLVIFRDSIYYKSETNSMPANGIFTYSAPSSSCNSNDGNFIKRAEFRFLHGNGEYNEPTGVLTKKYAKALFAKNIKTYADTATKKSDKAAFGMCSLMPVYNDEGLLVLKESHSVNFTNEQVAYLCLDVRNQKQLELKDMLVANTNVLSPLLEKELRKKYKLDPSKDLKTWLLKSKIPVTSNAYPAHKGIVFTYNPGELLPNDNVDIFLSYDDLRNLLTEDFKKRIGM
jgi:hypothetical protein